MSLINGRHEAEKESWWARRSRKGKVGIVTAILLALSGVAVAAFIIVAGQFSGTVEGGAWNVTLVGGTSVTESLTTSNCTVEQDTTDPNLINITWTDTVEGDTCAYRARFVNDSTSSTDLQYQNIPVPAGIAVYQNPNEYCGDTLPADGTTEVLIANVLEWDGTETTVTFDATNVHNFVRPSEFDVGLCDPIWTE